MVMTRSEKKSLDALGQTLDAIKKTDDAEELAILMLLAAELYADGESICEKKETGNGSAEAAACYFGVNKNRDKMIEVFRDKIRQLKSS